MIITAIVTILVEATNQRVPARSDRTRWIALFVVCLGQLMIVLDTTIVNVALPSIQRDLHLSQSNLTSGASPSIRAERGVNPRK
jgi:hypothetical protein